MTNAGLMDCKKALTEAEGDFDAAVDILRKKGVASAAKRAGREANEGIIAHCVLPNGQSGLLVEVNCETDFVAKNDSFQAFCNKVAAEILENPEKDLEAERTAEVAKIGENIQIARHQRLDLQGPGRIGAYIHTGAKVGVLVEVGCTRDTTAECEEFQQLVHDLTLQIAATSPQTVRREEIDPATIEREKAIVREQMQGKPPQAIEKIIQGKLEKFYQGICLVDQAFVKDGNLSIKEHVAAIGKNLDDTISVRRFLRFQVGEEL